MANVTTLAYGGTTGVSDNNNSVGIIRWEMDIADIVAAGLATGEYAVALNVPVDTLFRLEQVEVVTTLDLDSGASQRVDIGDSVDDDEFVTNATTLTAGTNLALVKNTGSYGAVYTTADTIRLKLTGDKLAGGTADATGTLRFVAQIADCTRTPQMTVQEPNNT